MKSDIAAYLFVLQSRINTQDLSVKPQDYWEGVWIKCPPKHFTVFAPLQLKGTQQRGPLPSIVQELKIITWLLQIKHLTEV